MLINNNFNNLGNSYFFSTITKKVREYKEANPQADVVRLGIGDVTLPLAPVIVSALQRAVEEMGRKESFKGYGEEQGYEFLRKAVCGHYAQKGVFLEASEIFISDGANSDLGNILDIMSVENKVLIPDPVYPVYVDTNIMAGREIEYINGTPGNKFLPLPEKNVNGDIVYICSPNNPTGAVYNREQLKQWVDWALEKDAIIIFDNAYESLIRDECLPTSVYQIKGAEKCAIEICSLSKTAGFTGVRCGYTVVPHGLIRENVSLNKLWLRRQTTKFNGVSYIVQRGAEAAFSSDGCAQTRAAVDYYLENARLITQTLKSLGQWFTGGENAPYIWLKCPDGMTSWQFFQELLIKANVVGAPGVGFGINGEGFFRLSAFGDREDVIKALGRIEEYYTQLK